MGFNSRFKGLIYTQLYTINNAVIFTGRDLLGSQRSRQISVYSKFQVRGYSSYYCLQQTVYRRQMATNFTWNDYRIVLIPQRCNFMLLNFMSFRFLTFKNRASYIQDGRTASLQMLHFIYIFFLTNISTEYFKHAAHSPFFSSKCRLFHNATFLVPVFFTFYIQGVLKFKCKTPVPKG